MKAPTLSLGVVSFTCALLATALVVWLITSGHESIFMNGPVTKAHASVELSCLGCHRPWSASMSDRCISCHGGTVLDTNHSLTQQVCTDCHREHQGREHDLKRVDVKKCLECHNDVIAEQRHPAGVEEQCLFCHGEHLRATFARKVTKDIVLPHKTHVRDPGVVQAVCADCHGPAPDPALIAYPLESRCKTCHFGYKHDTTKNIRLPQCVLCHNPDRPQTMARASGFATLRFSHADHQPFACQECHTEVDMRMALSEMTLPGVLSCKKCH